jgi:hypothetical protein
MSHPIDSGCPHSDDVLARHLDGHVASEGAPALSEPAMGATPELFAASLDAHLTECGRCQQALRRARRLDAALAHEAGQFVATQSGADGELLAAERWFAAVAATSATAARSAVDLAPEAPAKDTTRPQPARAMAARSPLRAWITSLAVAAGTLAAVAWWIAGDACHRDVVATPHAESPTVARPGVSSPGASSPGVSSPGERPPAAARSEALAPGSDTPLPKSGPRADGSAGDTPPVAVALDLRRLPKWVQPRTVAAAQPPRPDAARLPANRQLANQPNAPHPYAARQPDLHALRRQLDDGDVTEAQLVFCAQLAHGDLDEALRRHVRRCPQRLDTVVAALQAGTRQHAIAELLLDLWDDGVCRDRLADDEHAAARLFAGQGADTFRQLQRELATCAQAARRGRCLLALGCARDVDVSPSLLAQLEAPRHEEALLAAFALSCLPGTWLADVAQRAPTSFLLRAALLRSDADELAHFAAHCGEPAELRQRLRGASLPVFCELASWLRHGADASE